MENKIGNRLFKSKLISSLEKVFSDEDCILKENKIGSMFLNERYSFQLAFMMQGERLDNVKFLVNSQIEEYITVRYVEMIPSQMPCYHDHDQYILRNTPGLYPDALVEIDESGLRLLNNQWRSIFITIEPNESILAGEYHIDIKMVQNDLILTTDTFNISILNEKLPEQQLIHTQWFYMDCIASYYKLDIFSKEHWEKVESFLKTAGKYGINMILTPLFTPPLDTEFGKERPTIQLVDIEKEKGQYKFSFEKLSEFIKICKKNKIKYFEFAPFFTQWGSKYTPKIMAYENGEYKRIFGWDIIADSDEYKNFLGQFLPELKNFLKNKGIENFCFFHISDEPSLNDMENYEYANSLLKKYLKDFKFIDAVLNYEFYEKGFIDRPVVASNHIESFIKNNVKDNLWVYYCCAQYIDVANCFFNMPSYRNRILGFQLYKYNIEGFLHWGYNFWYTQFSKKEIDPFLISDAGCGFPSGDSYMVYPGEDGAIVSLRLEVLQQAIYDLRALKLLEKKIGRDSVISIIEDSGELTFSKYPRSNEWLIKKREEINRRIKE